MTMSYPPVPAITGANFTPTIHTDTYADISPSTKSDLTGRAVFISGASRGIGRATALSYARAGAAQIAVAAPNGLDNIEQEILAAASSMKREPPQTLVLELNVLDLASVKAAAQKTEHCFGKLDILINNAGYLEKGIPIAESDPDDYWKTWEINYRGLYWMTRAFLPLLLRSGDLRTIVNLSSMGALSLRPGGSAYQTSKFAILKFTEFVMTEYAEQGVLCYAVHPGGVMTELASNMPTETHSGLSDKPELAADTMVFLTQEKRDWLAGRYLSCKWDMPEFLARQDEIVKGDKLKMRLVI
uniref:Putative oxidoreductase n=1 Tax=Cladonia uncialis subsp. uncialis TaxID=180999 RepID=A0A1Z1C4R3_CLAUC|nr:putative oxidoreductase [Cladonia uncialis subsp. uncialis]AUW31358.1 putative oxidoreductase [Cladonia uncialis subsp. uncialis]